MRGGRPSEGERRRRSRSFILLLCNFHSCFVSSHKNSLKNFIAVLRKKPMFWVTFTQISYKPYLE